MSDEHNFDPKKFSDEVQDAAKKLSGELHDQAKKFSDNLRDSIHEQVHRNIHDNLNWKNDKQGGRRRPLVIGLDLRGRGRGGMLTGAIIVLIGLAFLLDNMGIIAIGKIWQFWPMLLVLVGVFNFASRHRAWGTFLMVAGVLLQLNELGKIHFSWAQFWPLVLIAVGLFVFWGSLEWKNKPVLSTSKESDPRTTLNEAVVFGGLERRMTSQDFQGGDVTAIFGGVELDLTEANIQANDATLAITAIFGGVELRIPPTWQVAFRGAPIFGGIEDKTRTRAADPANPNLKTLVITGAVIFGGLEIKN
jgi:predicted membrane protein